jgi:hypothetical protein
VGVSLAVGEDVFDDAFGQLAAPLVLFQNDFYAVTQLDLASLLIRFHSLQALFAA